MMCYEIDPKGDVILTLYNPNQPLAEWNESEEPTTALNVSPDWCKTEQDLWTGFVIDTESAISDLFSIPEDTSTEVVETSQPKATFRLSSRHLALASTYFSRMLEGPWKEATGRGRPKHINAFQWDEEAFLTVMNIIHHRNRSVPSKVEPIFLTKVAVIVDHYQLHEVVEPWHERWISQLSDWDPDSYGRSLVLRLFVAWVFSEDSEFQALTEIACRETHGPMQTLHLPFSAEMIDQIERQRQKTIADSIDCLYKVHDTLRDEDICSIQCASMNLGSLIKQMKRNKLIDPRPAPPFLGYSIEDLTTTVSEFDTLAWGEFSESDEEPTNHTEDCAHGLPELTSLPVYELSDSVEGLSISDFPPTRQI